VTSRRIGATALFWAAAALGGTVSPAVEAPTPKGVEEGAMDLVEITNGAITVGALPALGGRVVLLEVGDGENLLHSNPKYWTPPFPRPSLETPFRPWNGRIVWVGPQSGFWSQQEVRPEVTGAGWPPDPFAEAGRFEILEHTPTRLRLIGPLSPVTGLVLEHDYEITGERTVRMTVTASNGRTTPVSWDLWPNTRVQPAGFPYVPLAPGEPLRVDGPQADQGAIGAYPHEVVDGWLAMPPGAQPEPPQRRLTAKAFVRPSRGLIAFFLHGHLLLIRAETVPVDRLHPEQAFIELYRGAGTSPEHEILELEMHGPYETLAPGASMSFEQTFEVLDYEGENNQADHLARLAALAP
jgi:hypothetical protein